MITARGCGTQAKFDVTLPVTPSDQTRKPARSTRRWLSSVAGAASEMCHAFPCLRVLSLVACSVGAGGGSKHERQRDSRIAYEPISTFTTTVPTIAGNPRTASGFASALFSDAEGGASYFSAFFDGLSGDLRAANPHARKQGLLAQPALQPYGVFHPPGRW